MSTPDVDPVRAFGHALPAALRTQLNKTDAVVADIHKAVRDQHWTPKQLADECARDLSDTYRPGAVMASRLEKAAQHPPVGRPALVPGAVLPFCSDDCKSRAGWLEDEHGNLTGRCPCRTPKERTA